MSDDEDTTFESANADSSLTKPIKAGAIKKGTHVVLKGKPCKIVEYTTSKTGKHGHAKARMVGIDIFTDQKYVEISPTSHNMEEPFIDRKEYQLLNIAEDGYVSLLKEDGTTKEDLKLVADDPESEEIRTKFGEGKTLQLTVLSAMGIEKIIKHKEDRDAA
eukprot:TRINITY_DN19043_c0_g1_i1.p1 TRINITY_DN19043_c0_g1~~TRINITY_DN19043_c0_g1_i1.p1  ORF type:complete len:161 (-),score=41.29 TRINITY_DN19043_c0_g1_i1:51-533(-)